MSVELTPYIFLSAKILNRIAAFNGDVKGLEYYVKVMIQSTELLSIEALVEQKYYKIISMLVNNSEYSKEVVSDINALYKYMNGLDKKSYKLTVYFFLISIRHFHSKNNFMSVIGICKSALKYLDKSPSMFQDVRAGEFSLHQMESCLRLLDFKVSRECAIQCHRYFKLYSTNWSIFYETYFLLLMRTLRFREATDVIETISSSKYRFNKMNNSRIEKWKIFKAFLFFVDGNEIKNTFNLYKYLNEIKVYQRDKTGYFFTVWVSKILVLLKTHNYSMLYEIEDAFKIYLKRYINSQDHPRHYIFGQFILSLIKKNFVCPDVDNIKTSLNKNPNFEESEIIPYEYLLELIEELLKFKSRYLYA